MSVDPWLTTTYDSDTTGVATVSLQVEDFSLGGTNPVAGRTIVVHDSSGIRIGCGVLQTTAGEIVSVGAYPASSTDYTVTGTLVVTNFLSSKKNGIKIEGTLGGLEASKDGGIHILVFAVRFIRWTSGSLLPEYGHRSLAYDNVHK